ncbi:hypothetical protein GCM10010151_11440 [Actinoallomurus spadix]|uniref:RNA polymerase sigma factor 70 region 4 type 2 domain-containing protein n=1 Tax=Actinoallomurus spadix TaxID=79912 RepID=A0ABP3FSJ7_9ACTN
MPEDVPGTDDTLVLLFLCCDPTLTAASQTALTLRAVGGLTTAEIARAFLVPEGTTAVRISRAKQRIKTAGGSFGTCVAGRPGAGAVPAAGRHRRHARRRGHRRGDRWAQVHALYLILERIASNRWSPSTGRSRSPRPRAPTPGRPCCSR